MSKDALRNTGVLKKLTDGDYIPAERKFKSPFKLVNYAKLIFSANQIPITPDETDAFFARLIIINFPNQYLGDKADPYLIEKLTTEQELSGLLEVVLKRLPRVLKNGIYVSQDTIEQNYNKYIQSSNPVRGFVEVALEKDSSSLQSKDEIYYAFKMFCSSKSLPIESEQSFSRRLKKQYGFNDIQKRDNKGRKCYYWMRLKYI